MQVDLWGNEIIPDVLLRDKFIEPPFSVLDTKSGNWQGRKREWLKKGIKSEKGRQENILKYSNTVTLQEKDTSIFDPALCELMYKWFCNDGGKILDPFAGGSVRGVVAHYLKYYYVGIELRQEQVDANRENAAEILPVNNQPSWHVGDSDSILDCDFLYEFDMVFSCPPYMDLEVYSDDENDLSNMTDEKFIEKYKSIIKKSCSKLKKDGYAVFVVGDVRDKKTGFYKDFIGITKQAFYDSGMSLYNDAILLNPVASASMRAGKVFEAGLKLTKIHQNILVFKRGKDAAP
jgi:16S rRNA G966 N2-methylase RsmD